MTTLYTKENGGFAVRDNRKSWGVDVPAYVYDLWMPLIGITAVGIYGLLWRLARNGQTRGIGLKKLASKARVGSDKLEYELKVLQDCGFINISEPTEWERAHGASNTYEVLDPPHHVPEEIIRRFAPGQDPSRYEPLTPWLVGESDEVSLNRDRVSLDRDGVSLNRDTIDPSIEPSILSSAEKRFRRQNPYGMIKERQPEGIKRDVDAVPRGREPLSERDLPAVARQVMAICKRNGYNSPTITNSQLDLLISRQVDAQEHGLLPAPQQEYEAYPERWEVFVGKIEEMAWWRKNIVEGKQKPTPGNVIKAMRGYHWKGGWMEYRPGKAKPQQDVFDIHLEAMYRDDGTRIER